MQTRRTRNWMVLVAALGGLALTGGCSKSGAGGGGGGGGGGGAPVELSIAKLGLKCKAPKGSSVVDFMGDPAVKLPDHSMVTFAKPSSIQEAKLDAAIKDVKESYKGASAFKKEKLPSGWVFTYVNKAPIGTMSMVKARLVFGKKVWMCTGNAKSAAQQSAALAVCKSVKK